MRKSRLGENSGCHGMTRLLGWFINPLLGLQQFVRFLCKLLKYGLRGGLRSKINAVADADEG